LKPPARYLGGIYIQSEQSCWRWSKKTGNLSISQR